MLFSLKRISIANFRGVRDRIVLDFTNTLSGLYFVRGLNKDDARLGSNGAGKSTLFSESVIWVLTGRVSRSQRPSSDIENRRASGTTLVELEFALDDAVHKVSRSRNPNNLMLDGQKVEQQSIDALLPLTDAALRKSILLDQSGDMFLGLKPEAKSQIFTETLALDKWIRASDIAGQRADQAARLLQTVQRKIEGNSAAYDEARDLYELAKKKEDEFEADMKAQLAVAKKAAREAENASVEAFDALNAARGRVGEGTDQEVELNDQETQLKRLNRAESVAEAQVSSTDRELAKLNEQLKKYNEAALLCPECGQAVGVKHIREKKTTLLGQIEQNKQLKKNYIKGVSAVQAEIEVAADKIEKLKKRLVKYHAAQSEVAVCAERSIAADREKHRAAAKAEELRQRDNPFVKQCDELEARLKELRAAAKALKADEETANAGAAVYQFWQRGFREIRLQQIDTVLAELELSTNSHAEALGLEDWRIEFATERETRKGTVSHGFSVTLYPPDDEDPVGWETYSGGEVQRWQLATTFGLSEVLLARAGILTDFEVIDEPTSHLSPEGIEDLLVCLSDRARELNRRIFLIDHNSLDRGAFDGIITVTKTRERGTYVEDDGGVFTVAKPKRERVLL